MSSPVPRRSRTLAPLLIAIFVVVALIAVTVFVRQRDASVPPTTMDPAALPDEPAAAASSLPASRGDAVRSPLARADALAAARRANEERRELRKDSAKRIEALRGKIEAQYAAEKIDPAWAPGKQLDLRKISSLPEITSAVAAPSSMSVDCRSSMCRIESSFDSGGNAQDWTMLYMASVGSTLPNAVVSRVQNPDGTTSVRIYGRGR